MRQWCLRACGERRLASGATRGYLDPEVFSVRSFLLVGMLGATLAAAAPNGTNVTFNKAGLTILQKNCQPCHRPGEVAPISLVTYQDARPWAKSSRTAFATRKMPPWLAASRR